ncbi:hypothetical protein J7643_02315 [bacterium]|nr:hypothetical protein [bacterium]
METFVQMEGWRSAALLLNLITFFLAFSAFTVGWLIATRIRRLLGSALLTGIVTCFLIASGALSLRCLVIILHHLALVPTVPALVVSDVGLLVVGGALFGAYLIFERFLRTKEAR